MRAAIVENGVVVNVIKVQDLTHPVEEGQTIISAEQVNGESVAEKGWIDQGDGTFAPPEAE